MPKNYHNEFKVGMIGSFNPLNVITHDPTGLSSGQYENHYTNNPVNSMWNPWDAAKHAAEEAAKAAKKAAEAALKGVKKVIETEKTVAKNVLEGTGLLPHKINALASMEKMSGMLLTMIKKGIDKIGGVEKLAQALGIEPKEIQRILANPDTTDGMRKLADIAGVVSGMIDVAAIATIENPVISAPLALIAEQLGVFSNTVSSGADLIDAANRIGGHWDKGDYAEILKELSGMGKTLKNAVSDEMAEDLRIDELTSRFDDLSEKAKIAQKVRDKVKEQLTKLNTKESQDQKDILELEDAQDRDTENFKKQQKELDDLKLLELQDTKTLQLGQEQLKRGQHQIQLGQEQLKRGQHQIEAQNRRILAEEGVLESGQLLNRTLIRKQIKSSRNNTEMLRQIASDNRHSTQAIAHKQVILDNELQKLDNEELDEIDATMRMATKLDPPRTFFDFNKDLDDFESNNHRVDYIAENYDTFIRLPQKEIDNILEQMLGLGAGASF